MLTVWKGKMLSKQYRTLLLLLNYTIFVSFTHWEKSCWERVSVCQRKAVRGWKGYVGTLVIVFETVRVKEMWPTHLPSHHTPSHSPTEAIPVSVWVIRPPRREGGVLFGVLDPRVILSLSWRGGSRGKRGGGMCVCVCRGGHLQQLQLHSSKVWVPQRGEDKWHFSPCLSS